MIAALLSFLASASRAEASVFSGFLSEQPACSRVGTIETSSQRTDLAAAG